MHHVGDSDAEEVEHEHGSGEGAHADDVRGGRDGAGDDEDSEDCITQVAPHPAGADDAEEGEEEDQDRHFKDHAEAEHDGHEQTDVLVDGDHGSELGVESEEEAEGRREDRLVGEQAAGDEESDGADHERADVAALVFVESRER